MNVDIMYAQLPFSCSLCKAFGHSLARCLDNPKAKKKKQQQQQKKHNAKHNEADDSLMKECGNDNVKIEMMFILR